MAEVGRIIVKVTAEGEQEEIEALRRELARVNRDLSEAWERNAELEARDANAYMRAAAELELRKADSRIVHAEVGYRAMERRALAAERKLDQVKWALR